MMMVQSLRPGEADREPIDDYHVDQEIGARPVTHHILTVINLLLLLILAAVSFALFWVVATLLGFL